MASGFVALSVLALTGCQDAPQGLARSAVAHQVTAMTTNPYPRGRSEHTFFEIARQLPEFGGVHMDESDLVVSVTDRGAAAAVLSLLDPWLDEFTDSRNIPEDRVRIRKVQFGFGELTAWRGLASSHFLNGSDVHFVSVTERENMVRLGIESGTDSDALRAALASEGINGDAVQLIVTGKARTDRGTAEAPFGGGTTLSATFDPTPGGVGGLFEDSDGGLVPCTFGFNARMDGAGGDLGFVTAAHCSATMGGLDVEAFRQNGDSNPVGTEMLDPFNVCGPQCKWSDAAWYEFVPGRDAEFATVARTQDSLGVLPAARTVDASRPRFEVDGALSNPLEGEVVFKIGTVTGWTTGEVKDTCVNFTRFGFTLKCQDLADYGRMIGDSGAPVLMPTSEALPHIVYVMGVHNGVQEATGYAISSAIANIEVDFGDASANADLFVGPWIQ